MAHAMPGPSVQDPLIKKVKRLIIKRGGETGIRGLSRCFRVLDDDGDLKLTKEEFRGGINDFGLDLSDSDMNKVFKTFDLNGDGMIGITEFLTAFRVDLHPKRKAYINRVFALFDQNSDGKLSLEEFRRGFNAAGHPDYLDGSKTVDEVQQEFFRNFDDETNPDGFISKQEFEQQYSAISSRIDSDDAFVALLASTWNLDSKFGGTQSHWNQNPGSASLAADPKSFTGLDGSLTRMNPAKFTLNEKEASVDKILMRSKAEQVTLKVRNIIRERVSARYLGVLREFKRRDTDANGYVALYDVGDVFRAVKLHHFVNDNEMALLQNEYDTRFNSSFDYASFMYALTGDLPPSRLILLERTWKRLRNQRSGDKVAVEFLHQQYVPTFLPSVAKGQQSRGEALSLFLDAWDVSFFPKGHASFFDFATYYAYVSETVEKDAHFDTMVKVSWKAWGDEAKNLLAALQD
ncbi:Crustacean calcium-binding protein 23 [Diplonema papillatum]|nr:Crustacean calcium-binding protein 23 [Diplonema papillatum]